MATFIFTKRIIEGKEIEVFNKGKMKRDFTFIDDIVDGIMGAINLKINSSIESIIWEIIIQKIYQTLLI